MKSSRIFLAVGLLAISLSSMAATADDSLTAEMNQRLHDDITDAKVPKPDNYPKSRHFDCLDAANSLLATVQVADSATTTFPGWGFNVRPSDKMDCKTAGITDLGGGCYVSEIDPLAVPVSHSFVLSLTLDAAIQLGLRHLENRASPGERNLLCAATILVTGVYAATILPNNLKFINAENVYDQQQHFGDTPQELDISIFKKSY